MSTKTYTSGKDFLKDNQKEEPVALDEITEQPPIDELAEVHTPDISTDVFEIADKTFRIKISNIKTQKIMAKALGSINDLMSKINIKPIAEKFRDRMNAADKKDSENADLYVDVADIIKTIITAGGIDNILIVVMDIMIGVIYAICNGQDKETTRDWIEENINLNQAQKIFFRQMKKDEIQGKAIDFLALAVHLLTKKVGST